MQSLDGFRGRRFSFYFFLVVGTSIEQVLEAMHADKEQLADYALLGEELDEKITQLRQETMGNLMAIFTSLASL